MSVETAAAEDILVQLGLPAGEVRRWREAEPRFPPPGEARQQEMRPSAAAMGRFAALGEGLLQRLSPRAERDQSQAEAAVLLLEAVRRARGEFLRSFLEPVYAQLTDSYGRFLRVEELLDRAAESFPGILPTRPQLEAEAGRPQKDKEGLEIDQGVFLSHLLAHPRAGAHLVQAMLRPREDSLERLPEFQRLGRLDLGTAVVERRGPAGFLYLSNTPYLNAEDDSTNPAMETGVDLLLLDDQVEVGVLRGAVVDHPRYAGRRIFSAGLNLTHLYHGRISYLFYLTRDLGYVNKLYRGLSGPRFSPSGPEETLEKPWIAAVETFAIGGGCQLLLVMDRVLAERGAYFNLPARKEGIIPGAANLRLPRLVGDRLARQGIMFGRDYLADSPEGSLLCDEVVPRSQMDGAIERAVEVLTGSGMVSASGNRKALRAGQEPLDLFRAYMATYAREQAYCHFSPALIHNLERHWQAHRRRPKD